MIIEYEVEPLNPVNLEKKVGLKRGDILSVTKYGSGAVEINFKEQPTIDIDAKVRGELLKQGLPRGKKIDSVDK